MVDLTVWYSDEGAGLLTFRYCLVDPDVGSVPKERRFSMPSDMKMPIIKVRAQRQGSVSNA
jgi:hypothetical protein